MNWTNKHAQFCLTTGLTPSAQYLWQWLLQQKLEGYIEPDLRAFNSWVARWRRRKYCQRTLKNAFQQLQDWGVLEVGKSFGVWHTFRILVRSIDVLMGKKEPRKKVRNLDKISKLAQENLDSANTAPLQQQQLNDRIDPTKKQRPQAEPEKVDLCANHGIIYDDSYNLIPFSLDDIKRSLLYYWQTHGPEEKSNPQGWLIRCLQNRWWEAHRGIARLPEYTREALDELITKGRKLNAQKTSIDAPLFPEESHQKSDGIMGLVEACPWKKEATAE